MIQMKLTYAFLFIALFLLSFSASAQHSDILHLRSGTAISGEIVAYSPNGDIVFRDSDDGLTKTYPVEAIARIQQLPTNTEGNEDWWILVPELEEEAINSVVELKDGTTHEGVITAYERGANVKLMLEGGSSLTFQESEIKGITYDIPEIEQLEEVVVERKKEPVVRLRTKPVYEFEETGWFQSTSFAFSFGRRERDEISIFNPTFEEQTSEMSAIGFNVQHIVGYQFNRMIGTGVGVSYDAYDLEDGESILTLFGHYRAYLSKKIVAPFAAVSAGYGFALTNDDQGVTEADGGWMLHPEIGLRLGATNKANFTVGIGYRLQNAYYVQERPFNGNIEYRDVRYQRFLFTLGLLF